MSDEPGSKNIKRMEDWRKRRDTIMQMGGPAAVAQHHKKGLMTARERVDYLFDSGTFTEIGTFVTHRATAFGME